MPRVFVLESPRNGVNLEAAAMYGQLTVLFSGHGTRPSLFDTRAYSIAVLRALAQQKYDPMTDYFCVTGSVLAVAMAFAAIAVAYDTFRVLVFNASTSTYADKTFDASDLVVTV